jgi:hypothetical protein
LQQALPAASLAGKPPVLLEKRFSLTNPLKCSFKLTPVMAIVSIYKDKKENSEKWFLFRFPRIGNVDLAEKYFGTKGEFSPAKDMAFNKHLGRLDYWGKRFEGVNGNKIKMINEQEPLWY